MTLRKRARDIMARVLDADSIDALEQIVEDAANDDTISNYEYECIYAVALNRTKKAGMR